VKCFGLEKSSKRVKLDGKAAREAQLYGRLPNLWVRIAVFGVEVFVPVAQVFHAGSLRAWRARVSFASQKRHLTLRAHQRAFRNYYHL
jgi:hypothetical protein